MQSCFFYFWGVCSCNDAKQIKRQVVWKLRDLMSYRLESVDKEGLGTSPGLKERNYFGLSDCSSVDSSTIPSADKKSSSLNFKATELRLGLPDSQSPQRETDFGLLSPRTPDEKLLFPLLPCKDHAASGNKRGYLAKSGSNNAPAAKCVMNAN